MPSSAAWSRSRTDATRPRASARRTRWPAGEDVDRGGRDDCLHWLPADGYLLIVDNAPRLLADTTQDRHTLFRILARAVHHWASPLGQPEGKAVPFTTLLLCDRDEETVRLRQDIARALHNGR
ncbi:barstar family protein [Verrucosispora sp. ts21]|uniref:barstar family protein n=1 Tax=Verrucosispora sp. ts21 TaxID=2069341 RepID=UPI0033658E36